MSQKLFNCYNSLCNFTTYHGEKIYGLLVQATDDPSRHFIIPTYHKNYPSHHILKEWQEKENGNSNSSVLKKYGYEICDERVITDFETNRPGTGKTLKKYKQIENPPTWRTERKVEKLFIFGAGASYGMSHNTQTQDTKWWSPLVSSQFCYFG